MEFMVEEEEKSSHEYFQKCITDLFLEDKGSRTVSVGCKLTNVAVKLGD